MTARQERRRWLIPDSGQLQLVRPVLHGAAKEKLGRSHPMGVIVPSDGRELSCASL